MANRERLAPSCSTFVKRCTAEFRRDALSVSEGGDAPFGFQTLRRRTSDADCPLSPHTIVRSPPARTTTDHFDLRGRKAQSVLNRGVANAVMLRRVRTPSGAVRTTRVLRVE